MALRFSPARGAASFALSSAIRGPTGAVGPTGATGATGPTGATGNTGATGPGYLATSTTSNSIASSGSKSFTTQSGLAYAAGARVRAADTSNPSVNYMEGVVTSYGGTTLIFTADRSIGSGTLTSWTINLAGDQGAVGATGPTGPSGALGVQGTPTANQFGTWFNSTTMQGVSITGLVKGNGASAPAAAVAGTDYLAPAAIGVTVQAYDATIVNAAAIANTKIDAIEFVIDGGGATITTGVKGYLEIPFACTINRATLLADQSGSIVVDIFKDTYANYPPVVGDKITASAPPTISAATKAQDSTLTGWTTAIAAGDILAFNVNSITTCQRVTISLRVVKT